MPIRMNKFILTFLIPLFLVSCGEKYSYSQNEKMVCGLKFLNGNQQETETIGNPNDYGYLTQVYPSPTPGILTVGTWSTERTIKNIWFVKATTSKLFESVEFKSFKYDRDEVVENAVITISPDSKSQSYLLGIEKKEEGIYKVFVEYEDGTLEWFSIYKTDNKDGELTLNKKEELIKQFEN